MPMMYIGVVRVSVLDRFVSVGVGMGLFHMPVRVVLMLMMRVMDVRVFVLQGRVAMPMSMALGEMQPYPSRHEKPGDNQRGGQWRTQNHCQGGADKRRQRKIGAGSRG
ncbi:MAG TPA: hypothetical protein VN325_38685, partial [Steroidobacteraceae bacterium]|nr:hypothetical protein [Steroidobacteraceae bacterium]